MHGTHLGNSPSLVAHCSKAHQQRRPGKGSHRDHPLNHYGLVPALPRGKRVSRGDTSSNVVEGKSCSHSSGISCRYLAFFRAPSTHSSGHPFLTHRAQGRAVDKHESALRQVRRARCSRTVVASQVRFLARGTGSSGLFLFRQRFPIGSDLLFPLDPTTTTASRRLLLGSAVFRFPFALLARAGLDRRSDRTLPRGSGSTASRYGGRSDVRS